MIIALICGILLQDFEPRRILTIPEDAVETVRSADGRHAACVVRAGDGGVAIAGGPAFDRITDVALASNGRVAHVAHEGGTRRVVVDGVKGEAVAGARGLAFSADGKRFAYVATIAEGREVAVVDGKAGAEYLMIALAPEFAPDGSAVYIGMAARETTLVVGDRTFTHRTVSLPVFGGKKLAYVARTPEGMGMFVDGERVEAGYHAVASSAFSADGARFAYKAQRDGRWLIVVDGKVEHEYEATSEEHDLPVNPSQLVFSPDGKTLAYMGCEGGKRTLRLGDRTVVSGAELRSPRFSADGKSIACVVAGDKESVSVDGVAGESFDGVAALAWGNGAVAYVARSGEDWFVVAGARKHGPYAWAGPPRWSADGKKVAFAATEGRHHEWKVVER